MRRLNTGLIALALLFPAGTSANANMIINGDFEAPDIDGEWANLTKIPG